MPFFSNISLNLKKFYNFLLNYPIPFFILGAILKKNIFMKHIFLLLTASFLIIATSCNTKKNVENTTIDMVDSIAIKAIDAEGFAQRIEVLSSDEFEGRKPFTAGEEKTIAYLKTEFEKLGLQPGNGSSYFQEVPLVDINAVPEGQLIIKGKGGELKLDYLDDYVALSRRMIETVAVEDSELVFAGYGVVAPEYGWNDYEGLDVKGKTVLVMVNDPGFASSDSTLFRGKSMTYYGRWTYKYEEAARQGAAGVIIIHDTAPASYPWSVVRGGWSGSSLYLEAEDKNMSRAAMEGWVTLESAKAIFKLAGIEEDIMDKAGQRGFKPVSLGLTVSLTINNTFESAVSHNVLAVYPGTEQTDEYIIYTAHWDHLGIGEAINGDSIYNGAIDNATGTAALLEIAEAFTKLEQKPSRSILFLAVTAEEQGLLGSEYYASNPVYPLEKTVAVLNMDALSNYGRTKDLIVIGYGQSELEEYAEASAEKQGKYIKPDQNPAAGFFFRSDHFSFAKEGVPALYVDGGIESIEHGEAWGRKMAEDYIANRYHAPSDEFDAAQWDFSGMVEYAQLLFDIGYRLSNSDDFPQWKEGSEFKAVREHYMP